MIDSYIRTTKRELRKHLFILYVLYSLLGPTIILSASQEWGEIPCWRSLAMAHIIAPFHTLRSPRRVSFIDIPGRMPRKLDLVAIVLNATILCPECLGCS